MEDSTICLFIYINNTICFHNEIHNSDGPLEKEIMQYWTLGNEKQRLMYSYFFKLWNIQYMKKN